MASVIRKDASGNIVINPNNEAVDVKIGTSDRFVFENTLSRAHFLKRWSGELTVSDGSNSNLRVASEYDGTPSGNQFSLYAVGNQVRFLVGSRNASYGSLLAIASNVQVQDYNSTGAGGGTSEIGANFNVINCYNTKTNHDANYWLADWNQHGPASGQERFMGCVLFSAKYHSAETLDSSHVGNYGWLVSSKPGGGGGGDEGKSGLTSYRGRAAYAVNGWAGPAATATDGTHANATNAWEYCFAAGIVGSPWLGHSARSKYTTGFYATDFTGYGVRIGAYHPDATGNAIYTEIGAGSVGFGIEPDSNIRLKVLNVSGRDTAAEFSSTTAAGSTISPQLRISRDAAGQAAGNYIGAWEFWARNSTPVQTRYARIVAKTDAVAASSESGSIEIRITKAGSESTAAVIGPNGLDLANIPTADPLVAGRVWSNSGVLTLSAG